MFEKVKAVIVEKLNADGVEITESTSFKDDLNADSLDLFELVMALEDEFGIEIPSEELEKLVTVAFGNGISHYSGRHGLGGGVPPCGRRLQRGRYRPDRCRLRPA